VVTGSRIRGVNATGSQVIAIDQSDIAEAPVQSTADLLRRVPQVVTLGANPNGGTAQNGAANATRSAGINLRGLGTPRLSCSTMASVCHRRALKGS
jgi:iron complex outermembrane receptor protein